MYRTQVPEVLEVGGQSLKNQKLSCSRFKHGLPPKVSSGCGRLKGGDVQSATTEGLTPRAWAVGPGGEDVEIFTTPEARRQNLSGDGEVTLAKILYFFDVEGNQRLNSVETSGPTMEYVLVYEYVTCGVGRAKKEDPATKHPTYWLQGGTRVTPSVFPVEAIRRHIHMYHFCPASTFAVVGSPSSSAPHSCGLCDDDPRKGGGPIWKHHYNLAAAHGQGGRDAYMLNEHWRGPCQDGVI